MFSLQTRTWHQVGGIGSRDLSTLGQMTNVGKTDKNVNLYELSK